jgi:XapX domain-containing protein
MQMKVLFLSFIVGAGVGVLYGVIKVKSPAPPIVALLGLLGMVIGEQVGVWIIAKKISLTQAASVCLVGKHWNQPASVQPAVQPQSHAD